MHRRYEICTRLGIEFATVEVENCRTREAAIAWIVANQLGRRNLAPSQKAALALELEKQLAEAAKLRRRATQNNDAGKAVPERFPEQGKGEAREQAAKMIGVNPHYVTDAKKIEQDALEILDHVKQLAQELLRRPFIPPTLHQQRGLHWRFGCGQVAYCAVVCATLRRMGR